MNSPKLWICLLASVCFLSGAAAGLLAAHTFGPERAVEHPFDDYLDLMVDHFDLDADRERGLRIFMAHYQRELEDAKVRQAAAMEGELVKLGLTYRDLIRDHVLPEDRRPEFENMVAGVFPAAQP